MLFSSYEFIFFFLPVVFVARHPQGLQPGAEVR